MKISKENADHYWWGNRCEGWPLVDHEQLSVKQERMPAGTAETRHVHQVARQFFYVLSGTLTMEIEGEHYALTEQEGIEVLPGQRHQALNRSGSAVDFMVISQPSTKGDRIEVHEG